MSEEFEDDGQSSVDYPLHAGLDPADLRVALRRADPARLPEVLAILRDFGPGGRFFEPGGPAILAEERLREVQERYQGIGERGLPFKPPHDRSRVTALEVQNEYATSADAKAFSGFGRVYAYENDLAWDAWVEGRIRRHLASTGQPPGPPPDLTATGPPGTPPQKGVFERIMGMFRR